MRAWSVGLLLMGALAIAPGTLAAEASAGDDAQLVGIVHQALAAAPSNFGTLRAAKAYPTSTEIDYKPSAVFAKTCPHCIISDEFATAKTNERWAVQFDWRVDKSWTQERMLAYVLSTFGPLVPGASFTQGTDTDSEASWFDWKKNETTFLYVETLYTDKQGHRGFTVRVVHYIPKNVHVVRFARGLSASERSELVNEVRNFVTIALANVDANFASLRGKESTSHLTKNDPDQYFGVNMSFGEMLNDCDIDSAIFATTDTADMSHWVFGCSTVAIGGNKADVEGPIHDAVAATLPYGFTATTDPKYLNILDYRWDRSSDRSMISISTIDLDGGTEILLDVHHFIPNP